ncbi:MAG: TfoX/Sxy family protein [Gammaproteobacteria bacterium]|nr:TfoX/Sxy family protein [Gammaproteobacteria bacterium]
MAQPYLRRLEDFLQALDGHGFDTPDIRCQHFFSGAALYFRGHIFCSLTPVGFAVKLAGQNREQLLRDGTAQPLRYFPNALVKKDYVLLPEAVLERTSAVCDYLHKSIDYMSTST